MNWTHGPNGTHPGLQAWHTVHGNLPHRHAHTQGHTTGCTAQTAPAQVCKPGTPYSSIGAKIHGLADKHKYGVVREYVGHGVGRSFHSAPTITHFRNNDTGVMQPWQTFTIEPMLVEVRCTG